MIDWQEVLKLQNSSFRDGVWVGGIIGAAVTMLFTMATYMVLNHG